MQHRNRPRLAITMKPSLRNRVVQIAESTETTTSMVIEMLVEDALRRSDESVSERGVKGLREAASKNC